MSRVKCDCCRMDIGKDGACHNPYCCDPRETDKKMQITPEVIYQAIKHGDNEHKKWLRNALKCFFDGKNIPPSVGLGKKQQAIAIVDKNKSRIPDDVVDDLKSILS